MLTKFTIPLTSDKPAPVTKSPSRTFVENRQAKVPLIPGQTPSERNSAVMLGLHLAVVAPYLPFYRPTTAENEKIQIFALRVATGAKIDQK